MCPFPFKGPLIPSGLLPSTDLLSKPRTGWKARDMTLSRVCVFDSRVDKYTLEDDSEYTFLSVLDFIKVIYLGIYSLSRAVIVHMTDGFKNL